MKPAWALPMAALLVAGAAAQNFTQRGFLQTTGLLFPQDAAHDSSHPTGGVLLRYEASYKLRGGWRVAGALDARTDTHRTVEREFALDWWDRTRLRPAFSVRRLE